MVLRRVYFILFLLSIWICANAIPAKVHNIKLSQPDGSSFDAIIKGDEFLHTLTSADGYPIVQDEDGFYYYARYDSDGGLVSSGFKAGGDAPSFATAQWKDIPYNKLKERAAIKKRAFAGKEPAMKRLLNQNGKLTKSKLPAEKHGIVILAQFKDVKFRYKREDFAAMLTQQGYSTGGATGCALEYFNEQFGSSVNFNFEVSDIVTVSENMAYYGGNDSYGTDSRPEEMVKEACVLADKSIDFSVFDDDKDGEADNVFIFFAGKDEAEGGGSNCIWSHAYYIYDGTAQINLVLDGVRINSYACTSELTILGASAGGTKIAGIGAFCHEYSHTFGLPDFYDTDYGNISSAGLWQTTSLMDGGNSNNNSNTPPYLNCIERDYLEISKPIYLTEGRHVIEPISRSGRFYRVDGSVKNEYYLIECRYEEGWDDYIGGSGMLIYHVDRSDNSAGESEVYGIVLTAHERWEYYNEPNSNPEHQCADLIEADGRSDRLNSYPYASREGLFFPTKTVTSFSPTTTPAFKFWNGEGSEFQLRDITRQNDGSISFIAIKGDGSQNRAIITLTDVYQDAAVIHWEFLQDYITSSTITWKRGSEAAKSSDVEPDGKGKYVAILENLTPGSEYEISISADASPTLVQKIVTKPVAANGYPYIAFPDFAKDENGEFVDFTKIPLRINNAQGANVSWSMNGQIIIRSRDGYFHPVTDGTLGAVISWPDGSKDYITREITIKK